MARAGLDEYAAGRSRVLLRLAAVLTGDPDQAVGLVVDALAEATRRWRRLPDDADGRLRDAVARAAWRRPAAAAPGDPLAAVGATGRRRVAAALVLVEGLAPYVVGDTLR